MLYTQGEPNDVTGRSTRSIFTYEGETFTEPPPVIVMPSDPWPRLYFLENRLRQVAPYHFTYTTYCKERWRGQGLLDIFASEFRDRPQEYYVCNVHKFEPPVLILTNLGRYY
jgi:hypothetical protein